MIELPRSVYARGAEDGLYMGAYLSALMLSMGIGIYSGAMSILALAMMCGVPFLIYRFLRRSMAEDHGRSTFSALWLHGICIFFFGGMLMAVTVYVSLRFVWPGFLPEQIGRVAEIYRSASDPQLAAWADAIDKLQSAGQLPTPVQIALELVWAAVFTGSLLSMAIAAIVRRRGSKTPPPFRGQ